MLKKIHQSWLVNEMENPSVLAGLRVTETSEIFVGTYMKRKIHYFLPAHVSENTVHRKYCTL
jgi:hypothetical protein